MSLLLLDQNAIVAVHCKVPICRVLGRLVVYVWGNYTLGHAIDHIHTYKHTYTLTVSFFPFRYVNEHIYIYKIELKCLLSAFIATCSELLTIVFSI